jgi:hypothetical protein
VKEVRLTVVAMVLSIDDDTQYPCDMTIPPEGNTYQCAFEFKREHAEATGALLQGRHAVPGTNKYGDPTLQFTIDAANPREAAQTLRGILSAGYNVGDTQYIYHTGIEDDGDPFVIMEAPDDVFNIVILCAQGPYVSQMVKALNRRHDLGIAKANSYFKVVLPGYIEVQFAAPASQERLAQYQAIAEIYAKLGE